MDPSILLLVDSGECDGGIIVLLGELEFFIVQPSPDNRLGLSSQFSEAHLNRQGTILNVDSIAYCWLLVEINHEFWELMR